MAAPPKNVAWRIISILGCYGGLAASIALADGEGDVAPEPAPLVTPCDSTAIRSVDWSALFLGEFAVGGPAVASRDVAPSCRSCACDRCLTNKPTQAAAGIECVVRVADWTEGENVLWSASEVFEEETTEHLPEATSADAPPANEEEYVATRSKYMTEVLIRPCDPQRLPSAAAVRPGETAAEILKLRRAVGVNPVAGTIFDNSSPVGMAWAGDVDEDVAEQSGADQTLVEAIRQLEGSKETEQVESSSQKFENWPELAPSAPWNSQWLRPAEQRLEEAATLLEQTGQFEQSDAARELARQVRDLARQKERAVVPVQIYSRQFAR